MARRQKPKSIFDLQPPPLDWLLDSEPKITAIKEFKKKNKRVISFSLYNDEDLYNYGVLLNYELSKSIFEDWTLRVYFDDSANEQLIDYLRTLDLELFKVESHIPPMFYRFFPMLDRRVERFLSRDLDSVISFRDQLMVEKWLKSGKRLHLVHEVYPGHRHFIMGGMFGFKCDHSTKRVPTGTRATSKPISESHKFYYAPWKSTVSVREESDCLRFYCADSPGNFFLIKNQDIELFSRGDEVPLYWHGATKFPCRLENNDRIAVAHEGNNVFYFWREYELQACDIFRAINMYYRRLGRSSFSYSDDQNFLHQYLSQHYDDCLDHNNMPELAWAYSTPFRQRHKKLGKFYPELADADRYLGRRVDTREKYEACFNHYSLWIENR